MPRPTDTPAGPPRDLLPDPDADHKASGACEPSPRIKAQVRPSPADIVRHLSAALEAARGLDLDVLAYLVDLARLEAERQRDGERQPRLVM